MSSVTETRVATLASRAHDEWRAPRRLDDGSYELRIKRTKDEAWIAAHHAEEVDIANTAYVDLPADWQQENKSGAEVAIELVEDRLFLILPLDETFVEEASATVHQKWVERNPWAEASLLVPYEQLPEIEKEKDRLFIRAAIEVCQEQPV